jgi:hypothetical protein
LSCRNVTDQMVAFRTDAFGWTAVRATFDHSHRPAPGQSPWRHTRLALRTGPSTPNGVAVMAHHTLFFGLCADPAILDSLQTMADGVKV